MLLTDVQAVERCLPCLQQASLEHDRGVSVKNCRHMFQLLQLAIEYVTHLHAAHNVLLGSYEAAAAAAEG